MKKLSKETEAREAWIQHGRDLRREQYVPIDSVNNPSIRMLDDYKASLREAIEKRIKKLRNTKYKFRNMSAEDAYVISHLEEVLILLDTVNPKN